MWEWECIGEAQNRRSVVDSYECSNKLPGKLKSWGISFYHYQVLFLRRTVLWVDIWLAWLATSRLQIRLFRWQGPCVASARSRATFTGWIPSQNVLNRLFSFQPSAIRKLRGLHCLSIADRQGVCCLSDSQYKTRRFCWVKTTKLEIQLVTHCTQLCVTTSDGSQVRVTTLQRAVPVRWPVLLIWMMWWVHKFTLMEHWVERIHGSIMG
jgi:hypothetical protein